MRLAVDPSYLSGVLNGQRSAPLDKAPEWTRALEISGAAEEELIDALHLADASERVRALVDRLQAQLDATGPALARYRDRVAEVLYILTYIEAAPEGGKPPPALTEPADLLRVIAELLAERNRLVHGLPPPTDHRPRPVEPSES